MSANTVLPEIESDDFSRRFSLRARNMMWLLGAGVSAAAGIPTAKDMIWEFKKILFVSQRRGTSQDVANLANPIIRAQLQSHIDSLGNLPSDGSDDEYAALFEAVYPSEADRRSYLDAKLTGAKPSYGHIVLATFMHAGLVRLIWTTNFDPLVADACAKVFEGTGPLSTLGFDAPDQAHQLINEERWPIEIKMHGDFRSRRIKNTSDELRHQDARIRHLLVDSCNRYGLVIAGYSGRDNSVMDALESALEQSNPFPSGLFWLHRVNNPPLPRVQQLLSKASDAGVEAALVSIENFDETMRDLVRLASDIDTRVLDDFSEERMRWSGAPKPIGARGWPVIRLNAIPVVHTPNVCRRVVCNIGGYSALREAIKLSGSDILAARTRAGVLAYGSDEDIRTVLDPYNITEFDLHPIENRRLRYESGERGLLREALIRSLVRNRGLVTFRRRNADLLCPADPTDEAYKTLKQIVRSLSGTISSNPELHWREGISARLDWADDRLWLLIDPCTVFDGITNDNKGIAADFARERTVRRYNKQLNDLIAFWSNYLTDDGGDLRALNIGDGIDAVFRLSGNTAFSRRIGV